MATPRRALVVVDLQGEYADGPLEVRFPPRAVSVPAVLAALDAAQDAGLPVVVVQHGNPAGAAAFGAGSPGQALDPALAERLDPAWHRVTKRFASVFAGTGLADWLHAHDVDTVTLVGYMTNNCILASAAEAAAVGLAAEVLRDATGAIHLSNDAGTVSAETLHATLMVLLHSNFAAVATTGQWAAALAAGEPLPRSNLVASATAGREEARLARG